MNNLKNTRCYLSGAIENDAHLGRGWRDKVKSDLRQFEIQWMDPSRKPISIGLETPETAANLKIDRANGRLDNITLAMRSIRAIDLRMVTISDWLIACVDPAVPTFGTHEEITLAVSQNKPIFVYIKGGASSAPLWWFDMLPFGSMSYHWQAIYDKIMTISNSDREHVSRNSDYRWLFFDWMGE